MILYLLPILDILTASVLILNTHFGMFNTTIVAVHAFYLGFKGMLFASRDFASKIDVVCAVYIMLAAFSIFTSDVVSLVAFIWLVQKAVFALVPMR